MIILTATLWIRQGSLGEVWGNYTLAVGKVSALCWENGRAGWTC